MHNASANCVLRIDELSDEPLPLTPYIQTKALDMRQFDRACFVASMWKVGANPVARIDLIATEETETYFQLVKSTDNFDVTGISYQDMQHKLADVKAEDLPKGFTHWIMRLTGIAGDFAGAVGTLAFAPHYHFADLQGDLALKSWE